MNERRCHYSMFITRTLKAMWAVLTAIVIFIVQTGDSDRLFLQMSAYQLLLFSALVILALSTLILNFVRWRRTFIYVDEENLIVDRRTLNKNKTTVKLSTIASVNIRQGILEKVFGTYRLQLDINSSATANKTDFDLVFAKDEAQALRALLIAGSEARLISTPSLFGQEATTTVSREEGELICAFNFREVMRHCFLSINIISIIAAVFGFMIWFFSLGFGEGAHIAWLPIIIVVFPAVYQFIRPFFLYHNFQLRKLGDHLDVSYGLISNQHFSLPLAKTNAIIIRRPALARLFNLCSGEIINVGMGDIENKQAPVFCLLTTPARMQEVLSAIAPEYAAACQCGASNPLRHSPKSALIPTMATGALWGLSGLGVSLVFDRWWIGILFLAIMLFSAYLHWQNRELALLPQKISISSGIFSKRNITADYAKLQILMRRNGPISRHLGLSRGYVSILSTAINQRNGIGYFPAPFFDRIEYEILRSAAAKNIIELEK